MIRILFVTKKHSNPNFGPKMEDGAIMATREDFHDSEARNDISEGPHTQPGEVAAVVLTVA